MNNVDTVKRQIQEYLTKTKYYKTKKRICKRQKEEALSN